jgi:hypothetical protein
MRKIQELRNKTIYTTREAAISGITSSSGSAADGQFILGRYAGGKTVVGVKSELSPAGLTIIDTESYVTQSFLTTNYWTSAETQSQITNAINGGVADDRYVTVTGTQTVTGAKTFTQPVTVNNTIGATGLISSGVGFKIGNGSDTKFVLDGGGSKLITDFVQTSTYTGFTSTTDSSITALNNTIGAGATTANTVTSQLTALSAATKAATVASVGKTITVATSATGTDIAVNIDGTTIQKNATTGVLSTALKIDYNSSNKHIRLLNSANTELSYIDATNFVKDGFLSNVSANTTANTLVFTWNTDAGLSTTTIPLSSIADVYSGTSGVVVNGLVISGVRDSSSESFFTLGTNGFKLSGVQTAINTATGTVYNQLTGIVNTASAASKTSLVLDSGMGTTDFASLTSTATTAGTAYTLGLKNIASTGDTFAIENNLLNLRKAAGITDSGLTATTTLYSGTTYLTTAATLINADKALDTQLHTVTTGLTTLQHYKTITGVTLTGDVTGSAVASAANTAITITADVKTNIATIASYTSATTQSALATGDTINTALGKLEYDAYNFDCGNFD